MDLRDSLIDRKWSRIAEQSLTPVRFCLVRAPTSQSKLDPRRLRWLTDDLMAQPLDPTRASSFGEARKLSFQRTLLSTTSWRRPDWALKVQSNAGKR